MKFLYSYDRQHFVEQAICACESVISGAKSKLIRLESLTIRRPIAPPFYALRKNVENIVKNYKPNARSGRLKMTYTNAVDESVEDGGLA